MIEATPSTVTSMGYGAWGSVYLLATLGYGAGLGGAFVCADVSVTPTLAGETSLSPLLNGRVSVTPLLSGTVQISECD